VSYAAPPIVSREALHEQARRRPSWAQRQWSAWTLRGGLNSLFPALVYTGGGLMLLGAVIAKARRKR
jgi:hypothetical protein